MASASIPIQREKRPTTSATPSPLLGAGTFCHSIRMRS
jgi:hypothetical protein